MDDVTSSLDGPTDCLPEVLAIEGKLQIRTDAKRSQNVLDNDSICTFEEVVLRIVGIDHVNLLQLLLPNLQRPRFRGTRSRIPQDP
jgi:hypothetical protein